MENRFRSLREKVVVAAQSEIAEAGPALPLCRTENDPPPRFADGAPVGQRADTVDSSVIAPPAPAILALVGVLDWLPPCPRVCRLARPVPSRTAQHSRTAYAQSSFTLTAPARTRPPPPTL